MIKLDSNASGMPVWISRDILVDNYLNRRTNGNREQILDAVRTFKNLTHYSLQRGMYGKELADKIIKEDFKK